MELIYTHTDVDGQGGVVVMHPGKRKLYMIVSYYFNYTI